ncbi:MAG: HEAT repeat domain-containing protein [Longimicrobiales bacterium]
MNVAEWWSLGAAVLLAFLLTYALHSTVLLAAVAVLTRVVHATEWHDVLWRTALVGGVVTAAAVTVAGTRWIAVGPTWTTAESMLAGSAAMAEAPPNGTGAALQDGAGLRSDDVVLPSEDAGAPDVAEHASASASRSSSADRSALVAGDGEADGTDGRGVGAASGSGSSTERRLVQRSGTGVRVAAAAMPVVILWLVVGFGRLARLMLRRRGLFTLLSDRRPVTVGPAAAGFAAAVVAAGLRRPVRLTASRSCSVPMALTSREVCVPDRFLTDLDVEQQCGALAHEAAHLARRDPSWVFGLAMLEAVFFFQPLNAFGLRRAKEAAEYLCDDWAVRAGSGLGLARCLETVASWLLPGHSRLFAAVSAMAERRSTLVRRVERLVTTHAGRGSDARPATAAAFGLVLLVAVAAPAFTRPAAVAAGGVQVGQESVVRAPDPAAQLRERWTWALRAAESQRMRPFWIVWAFDRPTSPNEQFISDSEGIDFSEIDWQGTPLRSVLGGGAAYGNGTIAILLRLGDASEPSIDRIAHRSMTLGMDFDRQRVFWLGSARDEESIAWLETLLTRVPAENLKSELVEALALHATSSIVLPSLGRILAEQASADVRSEAAEGLEYHDVAASLALARETASTDASSLVRREAAEAIGGIQTTGSAAALVELALESSDATVRAEAAEALEDQPQADALPALERIIFEARDAGAQTEAVEALARFGDDAIELLRRTIWEHPVSMTRMEAVETLGDTGSDRVLPLLGDIVERHPDGRVQDEALDVLADMDSPRARTMLLDAVTLSSAPETRREAVERITEAGKDAPLTREQVEEVAAVLERVAFDDPDRAVRMQAVESMADLPRDIALPLLRRVIERHPDAGVRKEAVDVLADMRLDR